MERYESYKEQIPNEEIEVEKLEAELKELRRKARIHGVPKKFRE